MECSPGDGHGMDHLTGHVSDTRPRSWGRRPRFADGSAGLGRVPTLPDSGRWSLSLRSRVRDPQHGPAAPGRGPRVQLVKLPALGGPDVNDSDGAFCASVLSD